jgi:ankyrin repeat protein
MLIDQKETFNSALLSPFTITWLVEHNLNPDNLDMPGKYDDTALILASRQGRLDIVNDLLRQPVAVNHTNMDGTNALWAAIVANNFDIADRLLAAGIDLDNQNENGATALMYAASSGKTEWVRYLLDKSADVKAETLDGFNALELAANVACLRLLRASKKTTS